MANYCRAHKRVTLVYFPELRSNEDNKHQDNARASSETVRHAECTYIILFLTRHNETINGDKIRRTSRIDSVSPCLSIYSADDPTINYRALYDCDAGTWKVIFNSLYTNFIHSYIHGWSGKNHWIINYSFQWCHARVMTSQVTVNSTACSTARLMRTKNMNDVHWPFVRAIHNHGLRWINLTGPVSIFLLWRHRAATY